MRNPLIASVVTVTVLWYIIMYIALHPGGVYGGLLSLPIDMARSTTWVLVGLVIGAVEAAIVLFWFRGNVVAGLLPGDLRGLKFGIGQVSIARPVPPRVKTEAEDLLPADIYAFFTEYQKNYPQHAALFLALAQTLRYFKKVPASPIKGGHGGATAETHTMNVVREAIAHQASWVYAGHKNSKGKVVHPPADPRYVFNKPYEPLAVLCALAHDIGKVECYKPLPDGSAAEVKARHGEVGGKMLPAYPELWALPKADRDALILCVTYYHYVAGIPLWVNDRTRALTEFTIMVDIETGKKEGEPNVALRYASLNDGPADSSELAQMEAALSKFDESLAASSQAKNRGGKGGKGAATFRGVGDVVRVEDDGFGADPSRAKSKIPPKPVSAASSAASTTPAPLVRPVLPPSSNLEEQMFTDFSQIVSAPNAFGKAEERIGFKCNGYLHIQDAVLRAKIAALRGEEAEAVTNQHIAALLNRLFAMSVLYCSHGGHSTPATNAFYECESTLKNAKTVALSRCILVQTSLFPFLALIPDAPCAIRVIGLSQEEASIVATPEMPDDPVERIDEAAMFTVADTEPQVEYAPPAIAEGAAITSLSNSAYGQTSACEELPGEEQGHATAFNIKGDLLNLYHAGQLGLAGGWVADVNGATVALIPEEFISQKYGVIFNDPIENARWREVEKNLVKYRVLVVRIH